MVGYKQVGGMGPWGAGVKCGPASCFLSHLTQNLDSSGLRGGMGVTALDMLCGLVLGVTHKKTQRRNPMTAKGANLGRRWPTALLDSKATDGIVIARDFWQWGAPGGRGGPGPNPKKGLSWVGFLWFPFSQAPKTRERKVSLSWRWM